MIANQIQSLAERLSAKVPPGHVAYISKADAARACDAIANDLCELRNELVTLTEGIEGTGTADRIIQIAVRIGGAS